MKPAVFRAALALALPFGSFAAAQPPPALALYFPPMPPALGENLPPAEGAPVAPNDPPAPAELAAYVADPFYAPLSCQVSRHEMASDVTHALQSYLTTKTSLEAELRARLDTLREVAPEARIAGLREFAADQTPRLVELEATAENLRQTLAHRSAASRESQRWLVDSMATPGKDYDRREFTRQTALMVAYFADGPSPAQRRLLREIALDASLPAGPAADAAAAGAWDFSPSSARVSLEPSDPVSADLRRQIAEYRALQERLKADVRSVLGAGKTRFSPAAWKAAAQREIPLQAQLEDSAEQIRLQVVKFKDPAALPQVPLVPASMAGIVAQYRTDKSVLQRGLLSRVEAAKQAGPPAAAAERIRQASAAYLAENAEKYAALDRTNNAIHAQLAKLVEATPGMPTASTEALTHTFSTSLRQLQSFWKYREYQTAVFQPGLSPEQRRLLFDGALVKLALPLPGPVRPVMDR